MDEKKIAELLAQHFGVRVEPEMQKYALQQLESGTSPTFGVIGGDARSGVPVHKFIDIAALRAADQQTAAL